MKSNDHTLRKNTDKEGNLCFVFDKGETHLFNTRSTKSISSRLRNNLDVSFNTNHFHVIEFTLVSGRKVKYPIQIVTLWTANDLLEKGTVRTIKIIPITKKLYMNW